MNLSSMLKLGSILRAKVREAIHAPDDRHEGQNAVLSKAYGSKGLLAPESDHEEEHTAVILAEKKNTVRIACWNCGRPQWVKRGTKCHRTGLCGNCVRAIDSVSEERDVAVPD